MTKRFPRLFRLFREKDVTGSEEALAEAEKKLASDEALIQSQNRYIAALEGNLANQAEIIRETRAELEDLLRGHGKEDTCADPTPKTANGAAESE
ncbi:MAG: hypothetical protein LBI86_00205 [Treponema sp.]|jgi:uncharacterized coiled-coil protein SlyX|nr:hypothetical protein [Treponema sp.]